jgi:hypothetical protein
MLIRQNLGLAREAKCADFVGRHGDKWMIAESKGSNLQKSAEQLRSTYHALVAKEPGARGHVSFEVYTNADT